MLQIALIGIIVVLLGMQFKHIGGEYSLYLSIAGCLLIMFLGISKLEIILSTIKTIQSYIDISETYIVILLKIVGIAFIAEFATNICQDCGYGAVGHQIEVVGKLTILATGMPILIALLETIRNFLTV